MRARVEHAAVIAVVFRDLLISATKPFMLFSLMRRGLDYQSSRWLLGQKRAERNKLWLLGRSNETMSEKGTGWGMEQDIVQHDNAMSSWIVVRVSRDGELTRR